MWFHAAPGKRNDKDEKVTDMLYQCYDAAAEGKSYKKILEKIKGLSLHGDHRRTRFKPESGS